MGTDVWPIGEMMISTGTQDDSIDISLKIG
jgi:hypothetical protein